MSKKKQIHLPLLTPAQVGSGQYSGVFIDDSGTPGQDSPSVHLDSGRKTWVAVLMTHDQLAEAGQEMPGALNELQRTVGMREFHFADLFSGKGIRSIPFEKRLAVFRFMASIFSANRYPMLVQTFSPANIREHQELISSFRSFGTFEMTNPADLSLVILLWQLRCYFAENKSLFSRPTLVFLDEGRFKARMAVRLAPLLDFAAYQALFVRSSEDIYFLQLADFAAFALNRMQWILAKEERTDKDMALMQILDEAHFNPINIPTIDVDLSTWSNKDFEAFHANDRTAKGLSPVPGKKKEG